MKPIVVVAIAACRRLVALTAVTVAMPSSTHRKSPNHGRFVRLTAMSRCESPTFARASQERTGTASSVVMK